MSARAFVIGAVTAVVLSGCHMPGPAGDPQAVGSVAEVVAHADSTDLMFTPDEGYEYFEGTTFTIGPDVDVTGDLSAIEAGDRIEVWTEQCAESYPVQCVVTELKILD